MITSNTSALVAKTNLLDRLLTAGSCENQKRVLRDVKRRHIADQSADILSYTGQFMATQRLRSDPEINIQLARIRGLCQLYLYNREQAEEEYRQGIQLCEQNGYEMEQADLYLLLAENCIHSSKSDKVFHYIRKSISIYSCKRDNNKIGACYGLLARIYADASQAMSALNFTLKAVDYLTDANDVETLRAVYYQIAVVNAYAQNIDNALVYHRKALELNRAVGCAHDTIFSVLSITVLVAAKAFLRGEEVDLEGLLAEIDSLQPMIRKINRPEYGYYIYLYRCRIYFNCQRYAEVIEELQEAGRYLKKGDVWDIHRGMLLREMGLAYLRLDQYPQAIECFEEALELVCPKAGDAAVFMIAGKLLEAYQFTDDKDNILRVENMLADARQRARQSERHLAQEVFEFNNVIDTLHDEIALLRKQHSAMQVNLAQQSRKVIACEMKVAHMNQILNDIERRIRRGLQASKKNYAAVLRSLLIHIRDAMQSDSEWAGFEQYFSRLFPTFLDTLRQRYPQLTRKELRICAMLKLNLSTKEIAQLLSVSYRTIESARYRLRKKFDVPRNTTLTNLLAEIQPVDNKQSAG